VHSALCWLVAFMSGIVTGAERNCHTVYKMSMKACVSLRSAHMRRFVHVVETSHPVVIFQAKRIIPLEPINEVVEMRHDVGRIVR
jgi:hypothetical protein